MIDNLIIGADSMIGSEFIAYLQKKGEDVTGTTRRKETVSGRRFFFDLATLKGLNELPKAKVVYIIAAMARLEDCKQNPGLSKKVNVDAVKAICDKYDQMGAFIILLSTDKVFNGSAALFPADTPTDPRTEYGHQKATAEKIIKKSANAAIIRLTKVFGNEVSLFKNWAEKLKNNEEIHPFSDMTLAPVKVNNVCECLSIIAKKKTPGIYQLSGDKDISYADAARISAKALGLDETLIRAIKTAKSGDFTETAPPYASLDSTSWLPCIPINSETLIKEVFFQCILKCYKGFIL